MCTRPIFLRNQKYKNLSSLTDSYSMICVPCGDCEECLRSKANSVYVRARMEYDDCLKHGGIGFMCCLTYDDSTLPTIMMNGERVMVFNKLDVINFIKRLRTNLDRLYQKKFKRSSPDFKYLITSEYGTDPTRTHRPHYHLLFFFHEMISVTLFQSAFRQALYKKFHGKLQRCLGYVLQCDKIDSTKGGIHYSSKYVCKDIMYKPQSDYIKIMISFYRAQVNNKYGIVEFPKDEIEVMRNRCIRSRKDYKKDVEKFVRPWRHMLQFCMVSNDLGGSCIVEKYGEHLISMPTINFDGFPYAIPPIVKEYFEKKFGYEKRLLLQKTSFVSFLREMFSTLRSFNEITPEESHDLLLFAQEYVQPIHGRLMIVQSDDFNKYDSFRDWDDIINEFQYYEDNGFFDMAHKISHFMKLYNFGSSAQFRYNLSKLKFEKERKDYETKKRNRSRCKV